MIKYEQIIDIPENIIKSKINEYFSEDMPNGDKTSDPIFENNEITSAYFQAEDDLVLSGSILLKHFFNSSFSIDIIKKDGDFIKNGDVFAKITGSAREILSKERIILNLMQRMSGVATMTAKYVTIAKPYNVRILDTRKTTPGLRIFEKYSVAIAGGQNHRYNLSSGILIKDNHIKASGSITSAINKIKSKNFDLPIEIEVENDDQIIEALKCGVDGLLLDNYSPDQLYDVMDLIRNKLSNKYVFVEASGGINLSNLKDYVKTGIDAISSGALTHSVKSANIHLEIE